MNNKIRCTWCGDDPTYVKYHDEEWGVPIYNNKLLFAKLILDGAQAGLSWITILKKRDGYYELFDGLDPEKMATFSDKKLEKILTNPRIIRNRLKVFAARSNAVVYMNIKNRGIEFSDYLWDFVGGEPIINKLRNEEPHPTTSSESDAMSKALKNEGFKFVGSTICYAFMEAIGMVNDHLMECFRYDEVQVVDDQNKK